MKANPIIFRMAARCEAAGRPNNEDNYQISDSIAEQHWGFTTDQEISLGDKGALLVVCDGMGGMNAGEVASAVAVQKIKDYFLTDHLTDKVLDNDESIQRYIVSAIQAADAAIKQDGKQNPEHEGMGSTIVLAWLLGQKVYVGWCGDSRCYRYNPKIGLKRLSHDHSYVQELVDAGRLTEELAFDHPNNNIITRSLGDPRGKAQPDTKVYDLSNEDIILLCSDGLCGCLRDNEIEEVIRNNQTSMQTLRDALWQADEAAGWHDNVTIAIAQVLSGATALPVASEPLSRSKAELLRKNRRLKAIISCLLAILVLAGCGCFCWFHYRDTIGIPKGCNTNQEQQVEEDKSKLESAEEVIEQPQETTEAPTPKDAPATQESKKPKAKKENKKKSFFEGLFEHKDKEGVEVEKANDQSTEQAEASDKQSAETTNPDVQTDDSATKNDSTPAPTPQVEAEDATSKSASVSTQGDTQDNTHEVIQETDTSVTVKIKD